MYQKALIAILLVGLLFFGCTSPNNGGEQGGAAAGQQNQAQQGGNNQGGSGPQGGSGNQNGSGNQGGGSGGQADFTGKTFAELMALGVPMQCDITTTSGGVTVTSHTYKGVGSDMRSETPMQGGGSCPKLIAIMKADKYYVGCEQGELVQGCQWFVFPVTGSSSATGVTGSAFGKPDYSGVPAAQISCTPWIPDGTKFQEPVGACNLQDIMNQSTD